jgi:hypothetical protein
MTRSSVFSGWRSAQLAAVLGILGSGSVVGLHGCGSGHVGAPCTPEDEYQGRFAGFKLSEENIESRSFQCETRICLVNHFQGRVSCPLGQPAPVVCTDDPSLCDTGSSCQPAGTILVDCDPTSCAAEGAEPRNCNAPDGTNQACGGNACDALGRYCHVADGQPCPAGYRADPATDLCTTFVCAPIEPDHDTRCYVPGTEEPVSTPVCSQCSKRPAEIAVYCSCRCDKPEENPSAADENFDFCECPEGFSCTEIRKNLGDLGDEQLAGKYCVRDGTAYERNNDTFSCGSVLGFWSKDCGGVPPQASGG